MNIKPVSFGKAVRVNDSIDTARRIAELANSSKATSSEKRTQRKVKEIFDDVTNSGPAIAVELNHGQDVYVLSGKESEHAQDVYENMVSNMLKFDSPSVSSDLYFERIMQKTQKHFNRFLEATESVFELNVHKNKKGTLITDVTKKFPGVFAVAGTKEQVKELEKIVKTSKGNGSFMDATHLYKNRTGAGLCTEAAKSGKEIAFVVTGKQSTDNVSFMNFGWGSINGVSRHIDRFIELDDVKEQAKSIQEAMQQ